MIMLTAILLLLLAYVFPLWSISLYAPQYPDGVTMYIWINAITGDTPGTLQNINILNHYVGMKEIHPEGFPELEYFPYVVIFFIVIGLHVLFYGERNGFICWGLLLAFAGALGLYDFYLWEYDYGHNLDPRAPIKFPGLAYQPPLIGSKTILNFEAVSLPGGAFYFIIMSVGLSFYAYFLKKKATSA